MLFTLIRKNLIARPLRYVLTGLSIGFGVAAVTAVFIFTSGLRTTFDELSSNIESGYDVAVRYSNPFGNGLQTPPVPLEALDDVEAGSRVVSAQPRVREFGVVPIDGTGEAVIARGPNLGVNWESRTDNPRLFLLDGREPTADNEFAIDIDGFESGEFSVGESYRIVAPSGSREMELTGTFNFGAPDENSAVGAVLVAFSESQALEFLNAGRGYDEIVLVVDGDPADTIAELEPVLTGIAPTLEAVDRQALVDEQQEGFGQILDIFQTVLLAFAVIILIVSAFLIFNVFTITLGQRIKELGLLRSIGAFGSQITRMMLGEALFLGIVATLIGIPSGWLLARLLRWGLSKLGFPGDTGLPIEGPTIVYAVFVGIVVTLIAALFPSIRARQVTPMAALRDGAADADLEPNTNMARAIAGLVGGIALVVLAFVLGGWLPLLLLPIIGGVAIYVGIRSIGGAIGQRGSQVALLIVGLVLLTIVRFSDMGVGPTFGLLGAGALLTIVGASQVSGLFATPVARGIGWALPLLIIAGFPLVGFRLVIDTIRAGDNAWWVFVIVAIVLLFLAYCVVRTLQSVFGLTGQLARENAARNPSRTATTATALMIGLALVTGVTIIGESIKASVSNALGDSITSEWFIAGPSNGPVSTPFSSLAADAVEDLPEIQQVVRYRAEFPGFVTMLGGDRAEIQAAVPRLFAAADQVDTDPSVLLGLQDELGVEKLSIDDLLATDFATVGDHINADFLELDASADPLTSIWIDDGWAEDTGLGMGDTFPVVFFDAAVVDLTVTGIYTDGFLFGERVIDSTLLQQHFPEKTYNFITAINAPGVEPEAARTALEDTLKVDYPILTVQDKDEVQAEAEGQINQTLATVNVLLLLSAVIAILGIAIALALAVFERTREIGLLRAVGTTRAQARTMVRWEGVIVAAFGGLVGVIVGVGLGVLATQKMPEFLVNTTSVPILQIASYVLIAAVTGLGAGAFPAWVAGRMNVLDAISNE